ncbi:permease [Archangium sp. Cb G35]|uniref:ABC transporter permease n=1 Tax=Archangium sp. Cb G35 TaxID=1920190 RepID=UPI0009369BCF|nr:FtsX-like permease family protein [Archangium sp. Cb G35]OJT18522.1 permease [Archangium sp. Cb G35]
MMWSFALRNILARPRSWSVGLLAAGMAALLTLGLTLVGSIAEGTRKSLIESGAGHLQVYNSASGGVPQLLPGPGGSPELVPLPDYAALEAQLRSVEGVGDVVPLEAGGATVFRGNYLDERFAAVRAVAREPASEERRARLTRLAEDLRHTLERVARDARRRDEAFANDAAAQEDVLALEEAASERFWARFAEEPLPVLEFLENRVARQAGEGASIGVDYLGTDVPLFAKAFSRFELVTGELPPPGTRGLLLGHGAYEQYFKLPIAARLDELKRERERGSTFAGDEWTRTLVARNQSELGDLLSRLDVERASALRAVLVRLLGHEGELDALLKEFLSLDDGNFDARYASFYAELAPHLPLYHVRPGDTLVLRGALEVGSGVPVRVWGTFRFRGLGGDNSRANSTSLVDLVTARLLADRMTRSQEEEARRLLDSLGMSGAQEVSATEFGLPTVVDVESVAPGGAEPLFARDAAGPSTRFTDAEQKDGVLHAALVLKPGVSSEDVAGRIRQLAGERKLPLELAGWEEVGGFVSGLVGMSRLLLFALALLVGLFVLLVSAGTLLLLARERVGEVGTLRAVGMQRSQVFVGLLWEGLLLGAVGSVLGIALGAAVLVGAAGQGLPVRDESLQFFLGGPVLYLRLEAWHALAVGLGCMAVVMGASLVPAWRGSSVTPIVAMRQRED